MKEIITYSSIDDIEFDNRDECLAYETRLKEKIDYIRDNIIFYKNDKKVPTVFDYGNFYNWLDAACNECDMIEIKENLREEVWFMIYYELGFFFPKKAGRYIYDWNEYEWMNVAE